MANNVENELGIWGDKDELNRFMEFAKGEDDDGCDTILDFNKFVPPPKGIQGGAVDMDDWYCANWGTTANCLYPQMRNRYLRPIISMFLNECHCECLPKMLASLKMCEKINRMPPPNELFYQFYTIWTPPIPVVVRMGEMFPALEFEFLYLEGGQCFHGIMKIKEGKVFQHNEAPYYGHRGK